MYGRKNTANFDQSTFLAMCRAHREEILRHKWIESEKAGHDIGYDKAVLDWVHHHRRGWFRRDEADSLASA